MARASAAQWAKRVENWRDSGLTAKEFAAETGIKASTLTYWKWRLGTTKEVEPSVAHPASGARPVRAGTAQKRAQARASARPIRMVEVPIESVSAPAQNADAFVLELVVGEAVRVRVPRDFHEDTLRRVVRALS